MECPYCQSSTTTERPETTARGYRRFRCRACTRGFNERTGSIFNRVHYPPDVVCLVVLWRVRYKLSLRDLPKMFLERGLVFTHEAVREWEARFASLMAERLRAKRRRRGGASWYADETYVKVQGRWCYLYRAIDREGNLVDAMLWETRDFEAAKQFFARALLVAGKPPQRVTTDGHAAYPRAIRETLGRKVLHRCNPYLNSRLSRTIEASNNGSSRWGASRVSSQHNGFAESMTKYGTFSARAHAGMRSYRSLGDGSSTQPVHGFS